MMEASPSRLADYVGRKFLVRLQKFTKEATFFVGLLLGLMVFGCWWCCYGKQISTTLWSHFRQISIFSFMSKLILASSVQEGSSSLTAVTLTLESTSHSSDDALMISSKSKRKFTPLENHIPVQPVSIRFCF